MAIEILKRCQSIFGLIALVAIGILLFAHHETVLQIARTADLAKICWSVLLLVALHVIIALSFNQLHRSIGVARTSITSLMSYFRRLPARYLPGGLWHTVSRYVDIHAEEPFNMRTAATLLILESGTVAATGLLVSGAAASFIVTSSSLVTKLAPLFFGSAVAIAAAVIALLIRRGRHIRIFPMGVAAFGMALNWIGLGLAFAIYARGLSGSALASCATQVLAGTYDMSATVGYITVIAPQGWGVTEFVFGALGSCSVDLAAGVTVLAGFRVVAILADTCAFGLWMGASALGLKPRARVRSRDGGM